MLNPSEIYRELVEAGDAWAAAHEDAEMLRETQKILKAKCMNESEEKSISAKELSAFSDPRYENHVHMMVACGCVEAKAKVRYECLKIQAELMRTAAANERAANRSAT